ncbi:MAG: hypothetical protein Q9162_002882 [Coniocarpon cinnabarinum]
MATTAADTLALLDQRLARLEFQLGAETHASADKQSNGVTSSSDPVTAHVDRLENRLKDLCAKNQQAADILRLYERNTEVSNLLEKQRPDGSSQAAAADQTSDVLAAKAIFPQALSDLSALEGQQIPDARQLATLMSLQPRIIRALAMQQSQSEQHEELHLRSARLLTRWYEQCVVGDGEQWAAWEERLQRVDMRLKRKENAKRREEEGR